MRNIQTELVMCNIVRFEHLQTGIVFGVKQTRGNPEKYYIGFAIFDPNDKDSVTLHTIESEIINFPNWHSLENFVEQFIS